MGSARHQRIVTGLLVQLERQHGEVERIETHISTLLVTPKYTYKIKKPLDLGFLDFSTLKRRAFFCQEEVRLNSRLAPLTYQRAVPITGTPEQPVLDGVGEAIEYAVQMRTFASGGLMAEHPQLLTYSSMGHLAEQLSTFHQSVEIAPVGSNFGSPEAILQPMLENFTQIEQWAADDPSMRSSLKKLRQWTMTRFECLKSQLVLRKQGGFIRECHGDLHLGNITLEDGVPLIFDGIEFNPDLRWIDVASELAFLIMDLEEHGCAQQGYHFLNCYLELSGDYALLPLLRFYQVYRAMVRAKVTAIRLAQVNGVKERATLVLELSDYLALAERYTQLLPSALLLTHGYSGSGKSWYCRNQLDGFPVVVVRSDVERKRLVGLAAHESSDSPLGDALYSADFSRRTYEHLLDCAESILDAGMVAVIDATFLKFDQRKLFLELAQEKSIVVVILDFYVPEETLRSRIQQRLSKGIDPSEADLAVLQSQLAASEPLTPSEKQKTIPVTDQKSVELARLFNRLGYQ